ncbi:AAA family ATPase [Sorangium sp. So ce385]|uniref:AAA family ATPase n=1 Tax=Sorangium sp. So ce385 TaxID=3133308 RepID=UPI003F5B7254
MKLPRSARLTIAEPTLEASMTLAEGEPPRGAYVDSYELRLAGNTIWLSFTPDGQLTEFKVNKSNVTPRRHKLFLDGPCYLTPWLQAGDQGRVTYQPVIQPLRIDTPQYASRAREVLVSQLASALRYFFHGNTSDEKLKGFGRSLRIGTREEMFSQFKSIDGGAHFKERVASLKPVNQNFHAVADHAIAAMTPYLLQAIDQRVADFMSRVTYLAPLRATAERSYRVQDLSVSEVDPRGDNLAMFLRSLSEEESNSFAAFTREYLGFESKIRIEGIHAGILVKEPGSGRHMNLVDIGFGFSQVLPLTAILWSTCCRRARAGNRPTSILTIEQPELHLHPAHQAKLAPMLAGALLESRKIKRDIRLMIETHSEAIINGLGMLIHDNMIAAPDVQIVLFEQDDETRYTTVRLAGYDDDGALRDWPFGFFAPVADEQFMLIRIDRSSVDDALGSTESSTRTLGCIENLLAAHHSRKHVLSFNIDALRKLSTAASRLSERARAAIGKIKGDWAEIEGLRKAILWHLEIGIGTAYNGKASTCEGRHVIRVHMHHFEDFERAGCSVLLGENHTDARLYAAMGRAFVAFRR